MRIHKLLAAMLILALSVPGFLFAAGASEEAAAGEPRKVELKVFMSFPRFQEQFEAYFDKFADKMLEEENIDVTIRLEMPNGDQADQILRTRIASGDAPDVYTLHAIAHIPAYSSAGYMEDLSDAEFAEKLFDGVRNTVMVDGKVMALPLESLTWGYLYNKDMFAEYGLTPPRTLNEMQTVINTLNAAGEAPFVLAFQESWIPQLMMALSLGGVVNSEMPDFVEKMTAGDASYADVDQVFEIIDLIMANGTEDPFETGSMAGSAAFANGEAAMWVQGPWMAESILEVNPDINFGVAPLPVSNDPDGAMINVATSTSLAVSPESDDKDIAIALLNFILDDNESAELFESLKFSPVSPIHDYEVFPWIAEALSYVEEGHGYLDLSLPAGVTDETAILLQEYYLGNVSKADIIETLDATWMNAVSAGN